MFSKTSFPKIVLSTLLVFSTGVLHAQQNESLQVSSSANRSAPSALDQSTVAGNIYVFANWNQREVSEIKKVKFNLNGMSHRVEKTAPYDFNGGSVSTAYPFDTTSLTDGDHNMSVIALNSSNRIVDSISVVFTVANDDTGPKIPTQPTPLTVSMLADLSCGENQYPIFSNAAWQCATVEETVAGPQGPAGADGAPGPQGERGIPGINGVDGEKGEQGIQGPKGDKGEQGIQGLKGDKGEQGIQGLKGDKGEQGIQGEKGDTGERGIQGEKGDTGEQGIQGEKGDTGEQGIQGEKGDTGEQGIQGEKGDTGARGPAGTSARDHTIDICILYAALPGLPAPDYCPTFTLYSIGDIGPAGGIVFHVTNDGLNGLEAAPVDQGTQIEWGCMPTSITGADSLAIGSGFQNTNSIISECATANTAADIASNYSGGGYNDWFLPARDELELMYVNLYLMGIGDLSSGYYWSSSQDGTETAWAHRFNNGYQPSRNKDSTLRVRAIRAF